MVAAPGFKLRQILQFSAKIPIYYNFPTKQLNSTSHRPPPLTGSQSELLV